MYDMFVSTGMQNIVCRIIRTDINDIYAQDILSGLIIAAEHITKRIYSGFDSIRP